MNTGMIVADAASLRCWLSGVRADNAQGDYAVFAYRSVDEPFRPVCHCIL